MGRRTGESTLSQRVFDPGRQLQGRIRVPCELTAKALKFDKRRTTIGVFAKPTPAMKCVDDDEGGREAVGKHSWSARQPQLLNQAEQSSPRWLRSHRVRSGSQRVH